MTGKLNMNWSFDILTVIGTIFIIKKDLTLKSLILFSSNQKLIWNIEKLFTINESLRENKG